MRIQEAMSMLKTKRTGLAQKLKVAGIAAPHVAQIVEYIFG